MGVRAMSVTDGKRSLYAYIDTLKKGMPVIRRSLLLTLSMPQIASHHVTSSCKDRQPSRLRSRKRTPPTRKLLHRLVQRPARATLHPPTHHRPRPPQVAADDH